MANSARHSPSPHHIRVRQASAPELPEQSRRTKVAPSRSHSSSDASEEEWRDRALRLQAEMENYRKRQRRLAKERVRADQDRLLIEMLSIADNLDRTLAAAPEDDPIRQGVEMTRDSLLRLLERHGVERIEAHGAPFDPAQHEAVDVIAARLAGVEPGTVVRVAQPGYRRADRLLRPARVVVAQ